MFSLFRGKGSLLVHTVSTVAKCSLRIFGIRASLLAILSSNSKSFYLLESGYKLYLSSSDLPLTSVTLSPETNVLLALIDALILVAIQGLESCSVSLCDLVVLLIGA